MTREEYFSELESLKDRYISDVRDLNFRCADSNRLYSKGDFIKDDIGVAIVIDWKLTVPTFAKMPSVQYKVADIIDGKVSSNERWISQSTIIDK